MNTTTRRIVTTLAGAGLAAAAFASTGPAANAAGTTKTPTPIEVFITSNVPDDTNGLHDVFADYTVPVAKSAMVSVSCTLDGVQLTYCGDVLSSYSSRRATNYWGHVADGQSSGEHNFSVKVITTGVTYSGSTAFVLAP